ncbi:hypothetical protein [Enterococcus sp. AZ049]|uniref:hypothetical protein n=1 Tax=Enterococcus sp. AZ049 TaxID=2774837 RepID=UPI003D2682C1
MKKVVYGLLFSVLFLSGCSGQGGDGGGETDAKNNDLQTTIDSLRSENEILKEQLLTDSSSSSNQSSNESKSSVSSYEVYRLGEELSLGDGSQENARIKIIEATTNQSAFPEHMINLDDYDTSKMVAVKIEYTNVAIEEPFLPYSNYFQAYDKDGKALIQVNQQNGQDAVPIGRTSTTQLFWELPVSGNDFNEFEIDFVPSSQVATFDLEVTH